MMDLSILIPVLRRPQNIQPLVESAMKNTGVSFNLLFIASPNDHQEISELNNQEIAYITMGASYENNGDYARKLNQGFRTVESEWYFLGADDLRFHPGWFESAMETYNNTKACVIGTNDLGNPSVMQGQHATHSLVLRDYVLECGTIDEPGKILHEGYRHNFVDSELVETAKWRSAWAFARESVVEHLHPDWQKGSLDPVYQLGRSGWATDERYFEQRKRLWL